MAKRTPQPRNTRRRAAGMTSMLAMLYLVLFSTLAIGFYAATNIASEVTANDQHISYAFVASESGMDFMKYQLAHVHIPSTTKDVGGVTDKLFSDLCASMGSTGNLGAGTLTKSLTTVGTTSFAVIQIPGNGAKFALDSAGLSAFQSTITIQPDPITGEAKVVVKTDGFYGSSGSAARAIQMNYTRVPHTSSIFDYAVASRGQVVSTKGTVSSIAGIDPKIAAIMSDLPSDGAITMSGGTIGGDLSYVSGGSVSITGGSVGGSSNITDITDNHIHVVSDPEFPSVDPTMYKSLATNTYVSGAKTQSNIVIKAGTNPKFNANDTVNGIMYIESPNQVTFNGSFNLNGYIVMATSASPSDSLNFSGNLTMAPVPNGPEYDKVRLATGVAILAPNAAMNMTGSSGGNILGNVIAKSFKYTGAAALVIDQGTIITLSANSNSAVFSGAKSISFKATGGANQPNTGVTYSAYFLPVPDSYSEVTP